MASPLHLEVGSVMALKDANPPGGKPLGEGPAGESRCLHSVPNLQMALPIIQDSLSGDN